MRRFNDLAHSTGIGGTGALASRPNHPVPGLIEGRTKHSDDFGIARSTMLAISALRFSGKPAPLDRGGEFHFVGCDDLTRWAEMSSSVRLLRCNGNDARPRAAQRPCGLGREPPSNRTAVERTHF